MLLVTLMTLALIRRIVFPYILWLPWIIYLAVYIVVDYSFLGLQLTLQYTLPLLIGVVVSGFSYTTEDLFWLFRWFTRLCISVYAMFIIGYFFRGGYGPSVAATPMLLSVAVSLITALWFITREKKYLFYIGVLFLVPVLEVTRMGIAVTASVFIFHFANDSIRNKMVYGTMGAIVLFVVFNSARFQEKTFKEGQGEIEDLSVNYYDNPDINSSGRSTWKKALQPGLEAAAKMGQWPESR